MAILPKTGNSRAIAATLVAVLSWATVASSFKMAQLYFSQYEMLTIAVLTATVIFAVAVTIKGRWKDVHNLTRRDWFSLAILGIFNPTLYYLVLFSAYRFLPAQVAQPINYCWPIFLVILLAVVMHRPVRPRLYIGMVLSLGGVAVISLGGGGVESGSLSAGGLMLAFLSAVLWAFYWILNERLKGGIDENMKLFLSFLFSSIYLLMAMSFIPTDFGISTGTTLKGLLWSVWAGTFEMGIPFIFFSYALSRATNVALVNQMCYISPFLSLFVISMIVGETIVPTTYLGLALIVGGVVFNQYLAYPGGEKKRQTT